MSGKFEAKGLSGLSRCFRAAVEGIGKDGNVLFVGSPFTCLPFAEFLCYSIRDFPITPYFMPLSETDRVREIVKDEGYGYQLGEFKSGGGYNIVVLLGGIAMPKYGVAPQIMKAAFDRLPGAKNTIAVCFQGSLRSPDWTGTFSFRYLIDTDLVVTME
ncbi:MAG: DUF2124 family protein [Candidatus Methanosuratus sp.]|nr:DUF2124 family protein [Candidatus Methanosuratincola sp.]